MLSVLKPPRPAPSTTGAADPCALLLRLLSDGARLTLPLTGRGGTVDPTWMPALRLGGGEALQRVAGRERIGDMSPRGRKEDEPKLPPLPSRGDGSCELLVLLVV